MTISIKGIIHVTGEPDTGKTTFALECGASPDKICMFDDDVKGRATVADIIASGMQFGAYHDLVKLGEGLKEIEFYEACIERIQAIEKGQFDAIIFDTWTRFQKTMHPYVVTHPKEFREKWSPMGTIKGAEQWQEAERLEAQILNHLQSLCDTVIIITHLKNHYIGSAATGKQVPASGRALNRTSNLRLWLRHNPDSPVPIALVLKRINRKEFVKGKGLRTVNILPRKITPEAEDQSVWDAIKYYINKPIGNEAPVAMTMPDAYELSILDGTLTEDQRMTFNLMLKAGVLEEPEVDEEELKQQAREMEGSPKAIADELGVKVSQVVKWRSGG